MFGPNAHFCTTCTIDYSHRDKKFFDLFKNVRTLFTEKFNLTDYDILFLPGSGTTGIEAAMFSTNHKINVVGPNGTFTERWKDMASHYNPQKERGRPVALACQLETSTSSLLNEPAQIIDAVSSFPYYTPPKDADVIITASNKQLQSFAGLAIVAVKKSFWPQLRNDFTFSTLNLNRYQNYHNQHQTPATAPTYLFEHLGQALENFDIAQNKARIDYISEILADAIGEEHIVGEKKCPVLTVKLGAINPDICAEFDLYGHWTGKSVQQIFTYSCPVEDYEKLCKKIKAAL